MCVQVHVDMWMFPSVYMCSHTHALVCLPVCETKSLVNIGDSPVGQAGTVRKTCTAKAVPPTVVECACVHTLTFSTVLPRKRPPSNRGRFCSEAGGMTA